MRAQEGYDRRQADLMRFAISMESLLDSQEQDSMMAQAARSPESARESHEATMRRVLEHYERERARKQHSSPEEVAREHKRVLDLHGGEDVSVIAAAGDLADTQQRASSDHDMSLPAWTLRLFGDDAAHYEAEWRAHLWQLLQEGDRAGARRDFRRMILGAPLFALRIRASRLVRRSA
jgi:hypothetical protein